MTKAQRLKILLEWWPAACRCQGWNKDDRDLRLRVLSVAVSISAEEYQNISQAEVLGFVIAEDAPARTVTTMNELNAEADVDAVKACLGLLADNLDAAAEVGNAEAGQARRLKFRIHALAQKLGQSYLDAMLLGRFGTIDLEALTIPQLEWTLITGTSRLQARKRREKEAANSAPQPIQDAATGSAAMLVEALATEGEEKNPF